MNKKSPSGFVIIDKPSGVTSFRVLRPIKSTFATKRVGHAGTLDQDASGLIVAGVGKSTRLLSLIESMDKIYQFKLHLGRTTDTLEWSGTEVATDPTGARTAAQVQACLPQFVGSIAQVPPQYSAVKIQGQRASDIVHRGGTVELKPRQIFIHSLTLSENSDATAERTEFILECHCSKGTYVRALARDLGAALGTVACASAIRRTAIGAIGLDLASPSLEALELREPETLLPWPRVEIDEYGYKSLLQGRSFKVKEQIASEWVFAMYQGVSQAAGTLNNGWLQPKILLRDQ